MMTTTDHDAEWDAHINSTPLGVLPTKVFVVERRPHNPVLVAALIASWVIVAAVIIGLVWMYRVT